MNREAPKDTQVSQDGLKSDKRHETKSISSDSPGRAKRLLVLVNPHSGRGQSTKVYRQQVAPFLAAHNTQHEAFITTSEIRVRDYLRQLKLSQLLQFKAILVVSGDGLVFETVNALMGRSDWTEAIKIPIGVVPTGSGNGLAYTLIKQPFPDVKDQKEAIKICCKQAIQNGVTRADLVRICYGRDSNSQETIWSFLSFGWGLLADIDVDSDWLRRFGELRFTIYGLLRSVTSVSQRAKLSYLPAALMDDQNESDGKDEWVHLEDNFACLYAVYLSHISKMTKFSPNSKLTDGLIYLTYIRGKLSTFEVVEFLTSLNDGLHEKLPYVTMVPVKQFQFQPLVPSKIVVDGEIISWHFDDGPIDVEVVPNILSLLWTNETTRDELRPQPVTR